MRRDRFIAAALALAVLIALFPIGTVAGAAGAWTVTQLTFNDGADYDPAVSGDRVVWHGWDGNDDEVYTWTPGGGAVNISNHNGLPDWYAQVSGDRVVWQAWDGNDWEIYTWVPGGTAVNISNSALVGALAAFFGQAQIGAIGGNQANRIGSLHQSRPG